MSSEKIVRSSAEWITRDVYSNTELQINCFSGDFSFKNSCDKPLTVVLHDKTYTTTNFIKFYMCHLIKRSEFKNKTTPCDLWFTRLEDMMTANDDVAFAMYKAYIQNSKTCMRFIEYDKELQQYQIVSTRASKYYKQFLHHNTMAMQKIKILKMLLHTHPDVVPVYYVSRSFKDDIVEVISELLR